MDDSEEEEDMEEGDEDEDVLSLPFLVIPYFPYPCVFKVPVRLLSQSLYVLSIATISHVPDDASLLLLLSIELTCPDGGTRWYALARARNH